MLSRLRFRFLVPTDFLFPGKEIQVIQIKLSNKLIRSTYRVKSTKVHKYKNIVSAHAMLKYNMCKKFRTMGVDIIPIEKYEYM